MEISKDNIVKFSNEILTRRLRPVVESEIEQVLELATKAQKWVADPTNTALGLAANQIGDDRSWFVMSMTNKETRIVINPKILGRMGNVQKDEGCFSEEGIWKVKRPKQITVEFGFPSVERIVLSGRDAQVFCHEFDHLQGVLICHKGNKKDAS